MTRMTVLAIATMLLVSACTPATEQVQHGVIFREPPGPPAGVTVGPRHTALSTSRLGQRHPAVAFGDGVYLLAWQEGWNGAGGNSDILAIRLDKSGTLLDKKPLVICNAPGVQEAPAVAFCQGQFLVAWADARGGDFDIRGRWVKPDGSVSPVGVGDSFIIAGGPRAQTNPAIASNSPRAFDRPAGSAQPMEFLVAWQENTGEHCLVRGSRIGSRDNTAFDIAARGEHPDIAWSGSDYLVAQRGGHATLVGRDGRILVPTTQPWWDKIVTSTVAASAWGKRFVFVNGLPFPDPWGWSGNGGIIGATLEADGGTPERDAAVRYRNTKSVWLADGSLQDKWGGAKADGLIPNVLDVARWFNHPGWPMGMRGALKHTMNDQWPSGTPAACYNGRSLMVVWPKARLVDTRRLRHRELYMARVLPDWGVVDRPALKVVSETDEVTNPVMCPGPLGDVLLAYERVSPAGPVVDYRIVTEAEDRTPPRIECVVPVSPTELVVRFTEPIDAAGLNLAEMRASSNVVSAVVNADGRAGGRELLVTFGRPMEIGRSHVLGSLNLWDRSLAKNTCTTSATSQLVFDVQPGTMLRTDYVDRWCVIGPFPRQAGKHPFDPTTAAPKPGDAVGSLKWERVNSQVVLLDDKYGDKSNVTAYACVWAFSPSAAPRDAILRLDTNDHNRAWLNGRLVHDGITTAKGSRGFHDYADEIPVKLQPGWNRLMLQVDNLQTTWAMVAQIVGTHGQLIRDLTWQAERP